MLSPTSTTESTMFPPAGSAVNLAPLIESCAKINDQQPNFVHTMLEVVQNSLEAIAVGDFKDTHVTRIDRCNQIYQLSLLRKGLSKMLRQ